MGGLVVYTETAGSRHRQHRHGRPWSFAWTRALRLLPEPCSHHPPARPSGSLTLSHQRRQTGTVRAVLSVLAAVVFAWAVGRGCHRRVAGQSPAQPCKSTDALGGTWTALFPLPSLPSAVSPFHCPTDLQMTTSRRRGERCPLFCAHCESAAPLFWRRGDSAAALFWAVGKAKLVTGRRVEQRQKGGKRKTNRRAFHDPSTITPAAKGPGRKAGPATLSKLAFPAGSCRTPPSPPAAVRSPCNPRRREQQARLLLRARPIDKFPTGLTRACRGGGLCWAWFISGSFWLLTPQFPYPWNTVCCIFHPPPLSNLAVVNVQRLVSRPRHAVTCCPRAHVLPSSARRLLLPLLITACLCHPSDLIFLWRRADHVRVPPPTTPEPPRRIEAPCLRIDTETPPKTRRHTHTHLHLHLHLPRPLTHLTSPMQNTDQPASSRGHRLTPMSSSTDVFDDTSSSSSRRAAQ